MKKCFLLFASVTLAVTTNVFSQTIGLQLYSLRHQFANDVPGTMAKVRAMGFKEIELAGTYGLPFADFMKLIAQNELKIVSMGADFEKLRTAPQAVADEARAFGAKYVVCFWIPHSGNVFTKEDVDNAAEVFNAAGKILASNGLLLCYHPHGYEFQLYNDEPLFDYMMKRFDSRCVQFEMDVFWIRQPGQDPVKILKKYSSRFVMMHLKDRKTGTPDSHDGHADDESNVVLGTGDVGIEEVVREAKKLGIKHFFIEDESSRAEEQIPASVQYLKSLGLKQ